MRWKRENKFAYNKILWTKDQILQLESINKDNKVCKTTSMCSTIKYVGL